MRSLPEVIGRALADTFPTLDDSSLSLAVNCVFDAVITSEVIEFAREHICMFPREYVDADEYAQSIECRRLLRDYYVIDAVSTEVPA